MTTYYKAVRPDGTDFFTGTIQWAPPDGHEGEWVSRHPNPGVVGSDDPHFYLSVATVPTDCTGMGWPCRLLEVEAVGEVWTPGYSPLPNRWAGHAFRVIRELPSWQAFGPQGRQVVRMLERIGSLTEEAVATLVTSRDATWNATRDATWNAAWNAAWRADRAAAWNAAWNAAWRAAWNATLAVLARDLLGPETFAALTKPWLEALGPTWDEVEA